MLHCRCQYKLINLANIKLLFIKPWTPSNNTNVTLSMVWRPSTKLIFFLREYDGLFTLGWDAYISICHPVVPHMHILITLGSTIFLHLITREALFYCCYLIFLMKLATLVLCVKTSFSPTLDNPSRYWGHQMSSSLRT